MRVLACLCLAGVSACAAHDASDTRTRYARPARDPGGDTGLDTDTDTSGTTDTDTGTAPDPWADDTTAADWQLGIDVSRWQGSVDWDAVAADGIRFAVIKATESDYYQSPSFVDQYDGAFDAGLIRGAYHFAVPDDSDGATQATWFVENGGDWSPDGWTLPGVLDIEYNPYGDDDCYDLSKSEMISWILDFRDTYVALTGRVPMVYTNQDWWNRCVGTSDLPDSLPLWVAYWGSSAEPPLPTGWDDYTFWQYTSEGSVSGVSGDVDTNRFPGSERALRAFALDE